MCQRYPRRKFIYKLFPVSVALLNLGWLIGGCNSEESTREIQNNYELKDTIGSCNDLSSVSQPEIAKRKTYGYVTESLYPNNLCSNCNLYKPPASDNDCGGCILFEGPVYASGYCNHWEPLA